MKANELIDSALGGVLFVDEAYSLSNSGYSKGDAYGDEALQVLLKRAEDNRDQLVVILAGYPEGMDRLLAANPGLSSRFTTRVDFPSYRPLELTAIGEVLAAENGDVWDEEALDELRRISGHVVDQGWIDELGNGRFLRTLYEKSCAYRDLRLSGYPGTPTRDDLATLRLPDLMQAYGEVLSGRGPAGSVGPRTADGRAAGLRRPGPAAPPASRRQRRASAGGLGRGSAVPPPPAYRPRPGGPGRGPRRPASPARPPARPGRAPGRTRRRPGARWVAARRIAVRASSSGSSARSVVIGRQSCCGHRPVAVLQVEDVLDVQIAHERAAVRAHREAGVAGADGQLLDLAGGDRRADGDQ